MAYTPRDFPGLIRENIRLGREIQRLREELERLKAGLVDQRPEMRRSVRGQADGVDEDHAGSLPADD